MSMIKRTPYLVYMIYSLDYLSRSGWFNLAADAVIVTFFRQVSSPLQLCKKPHLVKQYV